MNAQGFPANANLRECFVKTLGPPLELNGRTISRLKTRVAESKCWTKGSRLRRSHFLLPTFQRRGGRHEAPGPSAQAKDSIIYGPRNRDKTMGKFTRPVRPDLFQRFRARLGGALSSPCPRISTTPLLTSRGGRFERISGPTAKACACSFSPRHASFRRYPGRTPSVSATWDKQRNSCGPLRKQRGPPKFFLRYDATDPQGTLQFEFRPPITVILQRPTVITR